MITSRLASMVTVTGSSYTHSNTQKGETSEQSQNVQDETRLSSQENSQLAKLKSRDTEVRAHEAAHIAAGGGVVSGGASFTYQRGPDGQMYAVGGEVPINTSGGDTPQESIANAQKIRAAALAPADPSPQDYKVAATASMMEAKARQELNEEKRQEQVGIYAKNQSDSTDNVNSFTRSA